jgi:hypothetical protein
MLRFFEFEVLLHKIDFPPHHPPHRRIYSDTAPRGGMASDARGSTAPWNTLPFRVANIRQNGSPGHPRPAGAALAGVHALQEHSSGRPCSTGAALAGVHAPQEQIFPGSPSS